MRWLAWIFVAACSGGSFDDPTGPRSACDPLDEGLCALPWPSSHFEAEDASASTGFRVDLREGTLPVNRDGVATRPERWNRRDGFSINSAAMAWFEDVSLDGTVHHSDIEGSLAADSKTILVDLETGERVPHWVELDDTAPVGQQLLILRPAIPYNYSGHYAVGIRGLTTQSGGAVAVSEAFRVLRDGASTEDPDVGWRRSRYEEEIFPALEAQGFVRGELQLAWDFHTASRDNTIGDLEHMRDSALAWIPSEGVPYTIDEVEDLDCSEGGNTARIIKGRLTAPYYTEDDRPSTFLARDEAGNPTIMGTREPGWLARIPCSVAESGTAASAPIVQYGHGLLGGRGEANSGWLNDFANERGFVLFAMDWTGFASIDVPGLSLMLALDPSDFAFLSERSHQGLIEYVLGMRLASTRLIDDPAFQFDGVSVMDPERRYYYGNSQGAIMGAAYMGIAPDVQRGGFGVGGAQYSLLLPRSVDFSPFLRIFEEKYPADFREITLFVAGMTQQLWDPVEGGGWMWDLPSDGDKQILMQVAIYDNQVTTLSAHIQARAMGAKLIAPATRPVWGLEEADATDATPFTGSALVEWRYTDLPDEPTLAVPPGDPAPAGFEGQHLDPHECPRREPAAQAQLWRFLETGEIIQTCEGPCEGLKSVTCP